MKSAVTSAVTSTVTSNAISAVTYTVTRAATHEAGVGWHLLGQQIVVQPRNGPDVRAAAAEAAAGVSREEVSRGRAWMTTLHNLTADVHGARVTWHDGQAVARELYGTLQPVTLQIRRASRALLAQSHFGLDTDFDGWAGCRHCGARTSDAFGCVPFVYGPSMCDAFVCDPSMCVCVCVRVCVCARVCVCVRARRGKQIPRCA